MALPSILTCFGMRRRIWPQTRCIGGIETIPSYLCFDVNTLDCVESTVLTTKESLLAATRGSNSGQRHLCCRSRVRLNLYIVLIVELSGTPTLILVLSTTDYRLISIASLFPSNNRSSVKASALFATCTLCLDLLLHMLDTGNFRTWPGF